MILLFSLGTSGLWSEESWMSLILWYWRVSRDLIMFWFAFCTASQSFMHDRSTSDTPNEWDCELDFETGLELEHSMLPQSSGVVAAVSVGVVGANGANISGSSTYPSSENSSCRYPKTTLESPILATVTTLPVIQHSTFNIRYAVSGI